jgi:hypothetical protein
MRQRLGASNHVTSTSGIMCIDAFERGAPAGSEEVEP